METVSAIQVKLVTLNDLKIWHSDALSCFEVSLSSQAQKFKNRTLVDFYYGYYQKPITKVRPSITPTSALDGMGEFLKAIDGERKSHEPKSAPDDQSSVETVEHPENGECVTKNLPGHYILMMEMGMPGIFVIVEEFPLLTDVKSLKTRLSKK